MWCLSSVGLHICFIIIIVIIIMLQCSNEDKLQYVNNLLQRELASCSVAVLSKEVQERTHDAYAHASLLSGFNTVA